jgi:hypothetical protein
MLLQLGNHLILFGELLLQLRDFLFFDFKFCESIGELLLQLCNQWILVGNLRLQLCDQSIFGGDLGLQLGD